MYYYYCTYYYTGDRTARILTITARYLIFYRNTSNNNEYNNNVFNTIFYINIIFTKCGHARKDSGSLKLIKTFKKLWTIARYT